MLLRLSRVVFVLLVGHASTSSLLSHHQCHRHAMELRNQGFTVIQSAGLHAGSLIPNARVSCSQEFAGLQNSVANVGLDPIEDKYAFAEIATRHRLRWGFQPLEPSAWTQLLDEAVVAATPVIEELHRLPPHPDDMARPLPQLTSWLRHLFPSTPSVVHVDAIVSTLGAKAQNFHPDAGDTHIKNARLNPRHRLFNVFCPLVDLAEDGDGTQFWPGSHHRPALERYAAAIERSGRLEDDQTLMAEMVTPECPAGGILLFDFRVLHRGMPNTSGERPIAHAVLSTGHASDPLDFPAASLKDAVTAVTQLSDDGHDVTHDATGILRERIAQQQRDAWALVRNSSYR